jgi:hypothetical protein
MPRKIELWTTGGNGPGAGWDPWIELRSSDSGFSIWQLDSDHQLRNVKSFSQPLSWREATYALRASSKYGLQALDSDNGDDFFKRIDVDGLVPWQADMLRLAWVNYENTRNDVLVLLLNLDDDQIYKLWSALGSFVKPDALSKLRQFKDLQEQYGLMGLDLVERIAKELRLKKAPSLEEFLTEIDGVLERIDLAQAKAIEPFAIFINEITERFSRSLKASKNDIASPSQAEIAHQMHREKCEAFRNYLKDFVLKMRRQPEGEHDIPRVGKIDLGLLHVPHVSK